MTLYIYIYIYTYLTVNEIETKKKKKKRKTYYASNFNLDIIEDIVIANRFL